MKTRAKLVGVCLALAGLAGLYLLPRTPAPEASTRPVPAASAVLSRETVAAKAEDTVRDADEARRLRTAAAYAELEASRKTLQKQLGDLKSLLWGRELPAEQARNISRDMMSAQYLLRNPRLLGAFEGAAAVYAEKDRVDAARARLQEISRTLEISPTP